MDSHTTDLVVYAESSYAAEHNNQTTNEQSDYITKRVNVNWRYVAPLL